MWEVGSGGLKAPGECTVWAPEGRTFWSEGRTHADAPEAGLPLVWARNTQEASKPRGEGDENREVAGMKLGGVRWVAQAFSFTP